MNKNSFYRFRYQLIIILGLVGILLFSSTASASVAGSTVTLTSGNPLTAGTAGSMTFEVANASPDEEWLTDVSVTFPVGWTVACNSQDAQDSGGNNVSMSCSTASNVVTYSDNDGGFGEIYDGQTWSFTVDVTPPGGTAAGFYDFDYTITGDNWGGNPHSVSNTVSGAIEVVSPLPACATNVSPPDGATDVSVNADLNWASGGGAAETGYRLYFGTDNPPTNIENGTDLGLVTTFDPGTLSSNTTYYWQIIAYNAGGDATGCSTWSFTTVPATISGLVFRDFDVDGTQDTNELGIAGVTVTAYDNSGAAAGTATTDANGNYTLSGLIGGTEYRLEFTGQPSYLQPGPQGADCGTTVIFATSPSANMSVGMANPADFCQNDPDLATPFHHNGDPLAGGTAASAVALVSFPNSASGTVDVENDLAIGSEVGALYGLAWQRSTDKLFASAVIKRHVGLGPLGSGGIYVIDYDYATPANSTVSTFIDLSTLGINTGSVTRNLSANMNQPNYDENAFDAVGKSGLGDLDISEDERTLWVVNLYDRQLYELPIGLPAVAPVSYTAHDINTWVVANAPCTNGEFRPWGLKVHDGLVYVGGVCSAENGGTAADLEAYVLSHDPAGADGNFSMVFSFGLDYPRGYVSSARPDPAEWRPWIDEWSDIVNPAPGAGSYGQTNYVHPMLTDIEFDDDGSMILGLLDRAGHQLGNENYSTNTGDTTTYEGAVAGDTLRVCNNGGTYVLENNAQCPGETPTNGQGTGQGPGNGEYYWQEMYALSGDPNSGTHNEISLGGLSLIPGSGRVASIAFDAMNDYRAGGVIWFDNSDGTRPQSYEIFGQDENVQPETFGKASGLGDLEALCEAAPIEIGNRVWQDDDGDGIQDPGEAGIAGVTVYLYDISGGDVLVGTATTDANGEYYFGGINDTNMNPSQSVQPRNDYEVRISLSDGSLPNGTAPSPQDQGTDLHDSDADNGVLHAGYATIQLTTGDAGHNDHTFDFGFAPSDYGDLPDTTAGTGPGDYQTLAANAGPSHVITTNLLIGSLIDDDSDGQPTAAADGDDTNDSDDEDGVTLPASIVAGQSTSFDVTVTNNTGSAATLYGFVDWNNDGDFGDADETASQAVADGTTNGTVTLNFSVPSSAALNTNLGARFRLSTDAAAASPTGPADDGEVEDYVVQVRGVDYGDLPDTTAGTGAGDYQTLDANSGPSHVILSTLHIGTDNDNDADGQPTAAADGDDGDGTDDEDGVTLPASITRGQPTSFDVTVTNNTGSAATLYGFVDWNNDGDFGDADETTSQPVPNGTTNGIVTLNFNVPSGAVADTNLGARFRLSTDGAAASPTGAASDGEVEDYVVQINTRDYGDLPDGPYATLLANDGPRHLIDGVTYLGSSVDVDANGQPSAAADGDDGDGTDDEDGVTFLDPLAPGRQARIRVTSALAGYLSAFIDFDGDGTLDSVTSLGATSGGTGTPPAPGVISDMQLDAADTYTFTISVPATATGQTPARFRFTQNSGEGGNSATGAASSGEVEDYMLASLGDLVWQDSNGNGQQDDGNTGVNGVTVNLRNGSGNPVNDAQGNPITTTTANHPSSGNPGYYEFPGLPPGDYQVEFVSPSGYAFTTQDQGSDATDSDADPITGRTGTLTLAAGDADTSVDAGLVRQYDWGDAPDTYGTTSGAGGANHIIFSELRMGSIVDNEGNGVPSVGADGDDLADSDDEDGAGGFSTLTDAMGGQTYEVDVTVHNSTGTAANLVGWIDFDGNGTFDSDEAATASVASGTSAAVRLTFLVPGDVAAGDTYARFRLTTDSINGSNPTGAASDGEVEDYPLTIITGGGGLNGCVYRDYDADGTSDVGEPGVANITVTAYDATGAAVASTTTDANGDFTLTGLTDGVEYRLEYTGLPGYLQPGPQGPDCGTTVIFATSPNSGFCVGVANPSDYCQTDPDLASTIFHDGNNTTQTEDTVIAYAYSEDGLSTEVTFDVWGQTDETGTVYGLAYQRSSGSLFAGAYVRRGAGLGPADSTGAIYLLDGTSVSTFLDLNTLGLNTGANPHPNSGATPNWVVDTPAYAAVGKVGLGDLDISDDERTLYAVNMYQKELVILPLGSDPANPVAPTAGQITTVAVPVPSSCDGDGVTAPSSDDVRPFALKFHDGTLYLGMVCSGQSMLESLSPAPTTFAELAAVRAAMRAYVYTFDPSTNTFGSTPILDFPLAYPRRHVNDGYGDTNNDGEWLPWTDEFHPAYAPNQSATFFWNPQPMLTDIEFDREGYMMLGLRDRLADQTYDSQDPGPNNGAWEDTRQGGDMLLACLNGSTWELESGGSCGSRSTGDPQMNGLNDNAGPGDATDGYHEFYWEEYYDLDFAPDYHRELLMGSLALLPGRGEVVSTLFDAKETFENGSRTFNNSDGTLSRSVQYFPANANFGKAGGVGDLELLCEAAPIEIGNRAWIDSDNDGIQDPGETSVENVTVHLYNSSGTLVATTTTDAAGTWYFDTGDGLLPRTDYYIVIDSGEFGPGGDLEGYEIAPLNNGSPIHDSNALVISGSGGAGLDGQTGMSYTTGDAGHNDHTLDFGFLPIDRGDNPDTGAGTGPGNYQTLTTDNGPSHIIVDDLRIGNSVDPETEGQQNAAADGDDTSGATPDDEDGVTVADLTITQGQNETVRVRATNNTGSAATLYGWIDFNGDGVFDNATERTSVAVPNGSNNVQFSLAFPTVPLGSVSSTYARFRLSTDAAAADPTGAAADGEVEDYPIQILARDYGDLPDTGAGTGAGNYETLDANGGPYHVIDSDIQMGASIDSDADGQPTAAADGDDADGNDDEEGVTLPATIEAGQPTSFDVTVTNNTGSQATLYGFVDWNNDGDFGDANETASTPVADGTTGGTATLNFSVPLNAVTGTDLGARFRLSTDAAAANPTGGASDGEVEDYLVQVRALDFGDLPDSDDGSDYPTNLTDGGGEGVGASHVLDSSTYLGGGVDAEADGQQSAAADGDDTDGSDDEDGVTFLTPLVPGATAQIRVTSASAGYLSAFIDFDGDGTLDPVTLVGATSGGVGTPPAPGVIGDMQLDAADTYVLTISVPGTATGQMPARFRFTANTGEGGNSPTGEAASGEVEDYVLASLGDYVWEDTNANGQQDDGNTGVNGVTVNLLDSSGSPVTDGNGNPISTTTTNHPSSGNPGYYEFPGLPPGDYQVEFVPPGGYAITTPNQGAGDTDSDPDPVTGRTATVTLAPGGNNPTVDAGLVPTGAIGNYVWVDENSDGYQDAGEPGIPNVEVELWKDTTGDGNRDTLVATTTTDAHGGYLFPDLPPGDYFVDVDEGTLPAGMTQTPPSTLPGADFGNQDHSGDGYAITLGLAEENLTADFGYNYNPADDVNNPGGSPVAALGDRVWIDADGDGVQDSEEVGVSGVELQLFTAGADGVFGTADDVAGPTTTTDANGYYLFDGLTPGAYVVQVTDSSSASHPVPTVSDGQTANGYTQTGDPDHFAATDTSAANNDGQSTAPVILGPGDVFLNVDFGYQPTGAAVGSIGDTVWFDADADGNGPAMSPVDGGGPVNQGNGAEDDASEYGLPGVTVALIKDTSGDGTWDPDGADDTYGTPDDEPIIATTRTNSDGQYLFEGLPLTDGDGTDDYLVWINDTDNVLGEMAATWDQDTTAPTTGPVTGLGISAVTNLGTTGGSAYGTDDARDQDFGYTASGQTTALGSIGDTVWFDLDNSGGDQSSQGSEPGVEGVVMELLDVNNLVIATTTTDENGHYSFGGLPLDDGVGGAGADYTARVAASNFAAGGVLEGMNETYAAGGALGSHQGNQVTLAVASPINLAQDFSYFTAAGTQGRIGNLVWLDANADGDWDGANGPDGLPGTDDDEPLIAGVTVDLYRDLNGNGTVDAGEPRIATAVTSGTATDHGGGDLGNYLFEGLPVVGNGDGDAAAEYVVDVSDRNGMLAGTWHSLGTPNVSNNSQVDPDAVEISAAEPDNLTADFGYYVEPAAVGNYVWIDANRNGLQDVGESPLAGVTVTLQIVYPDGTTTLLSTLTDASGYYEFSNLLLDEDYNGDGVGPEPVHTLSVATPDGYAPTQVDVNSNGNDLEDSDDHSGVQAAPVQGQTDVSAQSPVTTEPTIASYDFGFVQLTDLGDLPDTDSGVGSFPTNNTDGGEGVGASHLIVSNLYLGSSVDAEIDGQPTAIADGDDNNGSDDEDGVTLVTPLIPGNQACAQVDAMNGTGGDAYLYGWIDFNGDGDFAGDPDELLDDLDFAGGSVTLSGSVSNQQYCFTVPAGATFDGGETHMRFRLSTDAGLSYDGAASDGEVEDYYQALACAGNYLWVDTDNEGDQDEVGLNIPNVVMSLVWYGFDNLPGGTGLDADIVFNDTTDANGQYAFCGLLPQDGGGNGGTYQIRIDNPPYPLTTPANVGSDYQDNDGEQPGGPGTLVTTPEFTIPATFGLPTGENGMTDSTPPPGNFPDDRVDQSIDIGFDPTDLGDLPDTDSGANSFPTNITDGGEGMPAAHAIRTALYLGACVGAEMDGQPTVVATGDDSDLNPDFFHQGDCSGSNDDEDGVTLVTPLVPNTQACVEVDVTNGPGGNAYLYGWIDFNGDGDFSGDADELLDDLDFAGGSVTINGSVSNQQYCFTVPAGATFDGGETHMRFRLSTDTGLSYNGAASDGEVEDYHEVLACVGNYVWEDADRQGDQDPSESGIAGVTVELWQDGGASALMSTTTNGSGQYQFCGLTSGNYYVVVPVSNFGSGQPLENLTANSIGEADPDVDSSDTDDNGTQSSEGAQTVSPVFAVAPGTEPEADGDDDGGAVYSYPDNQVEFTVDMGFHSPIATAVTLSSFAAEPQAEGILLAWETATELDNLGFNLYRAETADADQNGTWVQLNENLIPGLAPGSPVGAVYDLLDKSAEAGITYYYWLETVDASGSTVLYGPATAELPVSTPTTVFRVFLPTVSR